jgi:putative sigma-54 modulation protein
MKIEIRAHDTEPASVLQAYVDRRLGFALNRFRERIGGVIVRFSNTHHRGRVDTRCQIDVGLLPSGHLRAEDTSADLFVAVDGAADRTSHAIARTLEREHGLFTHARNHHQVER